MCIYRCVCVVCGIELAGAHGIFAPIDVDCCHCHVYEEVDADRLTRSMATN